MTRRESDRPLVLPDLGLSHARAPGGGVLVGFDGSRSSEHALAYAAGVATRSGAELVVVHVASVADDPSLGCGRS